MIDGILPNPILRAALLFAAGAILSALVVRRMIRVAVMDIPVDRSAHDRPTPRGGGFGTVAAVLLGVPAGLAILPSAASHLLPATLLLSGMLVLAAVSWLDDLRQFSPAWKLVAQCAAAALGVAAALAEPAGALLGTLPASISGSTAPLFCLVGFCWLLLCTNAVNFMDGLNGLAAGVCLLCGLFFVPLGAVMVDPLLGTCALMLVAGLCGFLPFNFPSARIFLGDVGSQPAGFLVGGLALLLLADTGRPLLALAGPLILAGLLCDVLFTLARRLLAKERITQAHRGHLYQVAARTGLSRVSVTLVHWGFAIWGAVVSFLLLPSRPVVAVAMVLLPQITWGLSVRQRAQRAGLERWS